MKVNEQITQQMHQEAMQLPKETLALATRFVKQHGTEGLQEKMYDSAYYIGNDVDVIEALAKAQKVVESGFVEGSSSGGAPERSAADKLYGNHSQQT